MVSKQNLSIGLIVLAVIIFFIIAFAFSPELLAGNSAGLQKTGILRNSENATAKMNVTGEMQSEANASDNAINQMPSIGTGTSFITIDPIGDMNTGDLIIISGTTNLPPRTSVDLKEVNESSGETTMIANTVACPDANGTTRWIFALDSTSSMRPGSYHYLVSNDAGDVNGSVHFMLNGASSVPASILYYQDSKAATISGTGAPYITINPIGDRQRGAIFRISGTTNLVEGTLLSCTIWPLYLEDRSRRPATITHDPCDGQWYNIGTTAIVAQGSGDTNTWSFAADTTLAAKTEMIVHVSTVNEDFTEKDIYGNATFNVS